MKRKLARILIVAKDTRLANQISWKVRETFPEIPKILTETKIRNSGDIIKRGLADIFIVGIELSGGYGEDLIQLINELRPDSSIIAFSENEDVADLLNLQIKYENLTCITRSKLLGMLDAPLLRAKKRFDKLDHRRMAFPNLKGRTLVDISEVAYITTSGDDRIHVELYDWTNYTFYFASRKMSMVGFMKEYNKDGDFLRCHASYIVNKRAIESVDKTGTYLVLIMKRQNGDEIQIPISDTYRSRVLSELKGVF